MSPTEPISRLKPWVIRAWRRRTPTTLVAGFIVLVFSVAATPATAPDQVPAAPVLSTPSVAPCSPYGLQLSWSASNDDVAVVR